MNEKYNVLTVYVMCPLITRNKRRLLPLLHISHIYTVYSHGRHVCQCIAGVYTCEGEIKIG